MVVLKIIYTLNILHDYKMNNKCMLRSFIIRPMSYVSVGIVIIYLNFKIFYSYTKNVIKVGKYFSLKVYRDII